MSRNKLHVSKYTKLFFFLFVWGGGGRIGGRAEREREGWFGQLVFFKYMQRKFSNSKYWNKTIKASSVGCDHTALSVILEISER